ncbi:ParA family protein [Chryseobacterium sp.]|uniref:ParA family protein n=1 Tax=Chryseobacterium sp. TaxID=1871047 RepID=UPI0028A1AD7C|nr:ParA family protein [Chryseobacterium sp.]
MIITFATQKGGTGKTTLAIAFANYISTLSERKINVYDFDYQKSFYYKWKEDEVLEIPKLYDVEIIGEDDEQPFSNFEEIIDMKESEEINLFDLAGTLDVKYSDLLIYSDLIVIPFEYSDVSVKSTLVFINMLGLLESEAERIFIRSKYDKGYKYLNQEAMDKELAKYGMLLPSPVFKRNCLQTINTRSLIGQQKYAVENTFAELIKYNNETSKVKIPIKEKKRKPNTNP